jgi:hypothetical protein
VRSRGCGGCVIGCCTRRAGAGEYDPNKTGISVDALAHFLSADIEGPTTQVPGVGRDTQAKLAAVGITTTYQLLGKFLMLKAEVRHVHAWGHVLGLTSESPLRESESFQRNPGGGGWAGESRTFRPPSAVPLALCSPCSSMRSTVQALVSDGALGL